MNLKDISVRNAVKFYVMFVAIAVLTVCAISVLIISSLPNVAGDAAVDAETKVGLLAAFGLISLVASGLWLVRHISSRIDFVARETERLRAGDCDLTARLPTMTGGLGRLCNSLNGFVGQIHDLVVSVAINSGEIVLAARQISAGNTDLSGRTEQQASTLEETASSMEEFTSSVKLNAENTRLASGLAASASAAAQRGGRVAREAVAKISAANESSRKIGGIVATIDSIAFQTNILALNAAVEAARAGEQGRGFAVVATEVRELAQRSAASAKEIKGLVADAILQVDEGSKLVNDAGSAMQEIITGIEHAAAIMNEIAGASAEQAIGIEQVNRAVIQMEDVTQQNAALVEQAAAAADSMREQAESLKLLVARFRLDEHSLRGGVANTIAAVPGTRPKKGASQILVAHSHPASLLSGRPMGATSEARGTHPITNRRS